MVKLIILIFYSLLYFTFKIQKLYLLAWIFPAWCLTRSILNEFFLKFTRMFWLALWGTHSWSQCLLCRSMLPVVQSSLAVPFLKITSNGSKLAWESQVLLDFSHKGFLSRLSSRWCFWDNMTPGSCPLYA